MKRAGLVAAFLAVLATSALRAQQPVGPEFRLNAHTTGDQRLPAVSGRYLNGGFVVAWQSDGQDGDGKGVFTRVFDYYGDSIASFRVNEYTTGDQKLPSVAFGVYGTFVVAWTSYGQVTASGDVVARRFDSSGNSEGGEFIVNTGLGGAQVNAGVAWEQNDFMVVWDDENAALVNGRLFSNSSGAPDGPPFPLDATPLAAATNPDIAPHVEGFLVSWTDLPSGDRDVFARRFDTQGNATGPTFRVNAYTTGDQTHARVAYDELSSSNFVVVWVSPGQDGDGAGVFGRVFDYNGLPKGSEFQVNSYTTGDQKAPTVAFDLVGSFVVVWESAGQDGSGSAIYRRRFDTTGAPLTGELRVNAYTTGDQSAPVIADVLYGEFVVAWESQGQDGDGFGVYAQRFCTPLQSVTVGIQGNVSICSTGTGGDAFANDDGGGMLAHQWGWKTTPGGTFNPIAGATGYDYRVKGSDFPAAPGTYYLSCRTTPECGPVLDSSNVVSITIIAPPDDMKGPTIYAPSSAVFIQTLCT